MCKVFRQLTPQNLATYNKGRFFYQSFKNHRPFNQYFQKFSYCHRLCAFLSACGTDDRKEQFMELGAILAALIGLGAGAGGVFVYNQRQGAAGSAKAAA